MVIDKTENCPKMLGNKAFLSLFTSKFRGSENPCVGGSIPPLPNVRGEGLFSYNVYGGLAVTYGGKSNSNPCTIARRRFCTPAGVFFSGKGGAL